MIDEIGLLFRGIQDEDKGAFLALVESVPFEIGEVVLAAGRSEWDMHIVMEGELSMWFGNVRLTDLGPGQTLGSSAILIPQVQRSAARGNRKGVLLKLPREAIVEFFESKPERILQQFCVNLFKVWVEILKYRNDRITDLQSQLLDVTPADLDRRYKLLLVEDEVVILNAMEEFFKDKYDVVKAVDGTTEITLTESENPDLVLLDLRLPELDGFQMCQRLKGHPDTGHIPIIMVTALTATPDKVKGLMYGADEYLVKPVDLRHLQETVGRVLEKLYG